MGETLLRHKYNIINILNKLFIVIVVRMPMIDNINNNSDILIYRLDNL